MSVASMPQHVVVQRERTQELACAHNPLSLALSHCDAPPAAESGAQFAMLAQRNTVPSPAEFNKIHAKSDEG